MLVMFLLLILAYPGCTLHFNTTVTTNSTYLYAIAPNGSIVHSGKIIHVAFDTPPGTYWLKAGRSWLKVKVVRNCTLSLERAHELERDYVAIFRRSVALKSKLKELNETLAMKEKKIESLQKKINSLNASLTDLESQIRTLKSLLGFVLGLCVGSILALIVLRRKHVF